MKAGRLTLFDLDGTLLPTDSDHAFGEFLIGLGWADGEAYRRRNDAFFHAYQEGALDRMLPVADLVRGCFGGTQLPDGWAMFGGTFAAKGGIRPASRFEVELEDPVLKRRIGHAYDVIELPVLG